MPPRTGSPAERAAHAQWIADNPAEAAALGLKPAGRQLGQADIDAMPPAAVAEATRQGLFDDFLSTPNPQPTDPSA